MKVDRPQLRKQSNNSNNNGVLKANNYLSIFYLLGIVEGILPAHPYLISVTAHGWVI